MNWVLLVLVYIVVWCLTLQAVLPFGVRPPVVHGTGHDHGAPDKPYLGMKLLATTFIAAFITAGINYLAVHDVFHVGEGL